MRIVISGDWHSELHEEAVYRAFQALGHEAFRFSWHEYFEPFRVSHFLAVPDMMARKVQRKFILGPLVNRLNRDLLSTIRRIRPDILFVYRGTHVRQETLRSIREISPATMLVGYNNDDPFARGYPSWIWRHFMASVPEYDLVLAYRHHNIKEFKKAGAKECRLLRSWFIQERNYPVCLTPDEREQFSCDVVFIGHYEPDGRLEMLEEVVRQGFQLRLFGPPYEWHPVLKKSKLLQKFMPVRLVWGEEYNKAICGAKIALCFLSKLNRDTYTRRCFEIPASGTLMLSEYTDDLASIYQPGIEADFFRSKEELGRKVRWYIENDEFRRKVAAAGHKRVSEDGHDVVSRMRQLLVWIEEIGKNQRTVLSNQG